MYNIPKQNKVKRAIIFDNSIKRNYFYCNVITKKLS